MSLYDSLQTISQAKKSYKQHQDFQNLINKTGYDHWNDWQQKNRELGIQLSGNELLQEFTNWASTHYCGRIGTIASHEVSSEAIIIRCIEKWELVSDLIIKFERHVLASDANRQFFINDAKNVLADATAKGDDKYLYSKKIAAAFSSYLSKELGIQCTLSETSCIPNVKAITYDLNSHDKYAKADWHREASIQLEVNKQLSEEIGKFVAQAQPTLAAKLQREAEETANEQSQKSKALLILGAVAIILFVLLKSH